MSESYEVRGELLVGEVGHLFIRSEEGDAIALDTAIAKWAIDSEIELVEVIVRRATKRRTASHSDAARASNPASNDPGGVRHGAGFVREHRVPATPGAPRLPQESRARARGIDPG